VSSPQPQTTSARPSKVTLAASMGGVSCLVLIFSLFDTLTRLRGVDMRDQVTKSLSEPPFDTLGVSVGDVLAGMRALAFVSGGLAAAGVVLAVFVFRRHRGARIGFTVVAALLLLTTPVAGMLTFLIGIAAVLLWSEPARAWFAGRAPEDAKARRREEALMSAGDRPGGQGPQGWPYGEPDRTGEEPAAPVPPPANGSGDAPQPPPYQGSYGEAPTPPAPSDSPAPQAPWQSGQPGQPGQQGPYAQGVGYPAGPYGQQQYGQHPQGGYPYGGYPSQGGGGKRPATVTWAAALSILGSLLGLLAGGLLMIGLTLDSGTLGDEIQRDENFDRIGWDVDQVLAVVWVTAVVIVIWSLSALVLAIFTLRRQQWARWLLVLSAAATALVSLVAILSLVSVIPFVMAVATVILLFTGGANAWFSGQDRQPPSGPQWSSQPGPW
jgi:hypothetical protein